MCSGVCSLGCWCDANTCFGRAYVTLQGCVRCGKCVSRYVGGGYFRLCGVKVLVGPIGQVCVGVCALGDVLGGCSSYLILLCLREGLMVV